MSADERYVDSHRLVAAIRRVRIAGPGDWSIPQEHTGLAGAGPESEPKHKILEAAVQFQPSTLSSVTRSEQLSIFYLPPRRT